MSTRFCIEDNCNNAVAWVRHTQFAGSHPFCDKHARKEKNFNKDDSYQIWEEIPSNHYRYQIAVAGHVVSYLKHKKDVQDKFLQEIGTCPEWGLYDTKLNKYVKCDWDNLGLDPELLDQIGKYRMAINGLWGDAVRTRK